MKRRVNKNKRRKSPWFLALVFLLGLAIASYPLISQYYYRIQSNEEIAKFNKSISDIPSEKLAERLHLAQAFNSTLKPSELRDPFSAEEKEAGVTEYGKMLVIQERLGYVEIPKIDEAIPMYVGTSSDILERGAGLLEGTSLPVGGESTHTVITAHRGLPNAKLFTDLNKLKKGDIFYIHVLDQVLAYKVDQILTVEPTNFEPVLIEKGKDYATLLTCTPYMINSHRLLVRGIRVPYTAPIKELSIELREARQQYMILLVVSVVIILVLLYLVYRTRKAVQTITKELEGYHEE
ncbi:class C sortase [Streptococcus moroccensis]|uniref:LPXTG-site transpeptidase (Sortase) family protein n=1 Tax=Streptococcus moroccensis TaxID=1451356 RepID=A0ABT9YTX1_9STRE|nr:class C sortase [Streptococcus moroccensis]MDQ0223436.1 LPXTG-site transpeptidase (sortase) family protein [Streptococcus moroccensis]